MMRRAVAGLARLKARTGRIALVLGFLLQAGCDTASRTAVVVTGGIDGIDGTLRSLVVSSGALSPAFSPPVVAYFLPESRDIGSISITATAITPDATVIVNSEVLPSGVASQPILLPIGTSTITVTVTLPNSTSTTTYTITVNRAQ